MGRGAPLPIDHGAAGIWKAEELRHLVIGFARGVVARFANQLIFQMTEVAGFGFHPEQIRMTAGDDKSEGREFNFGMLERNRIDVTFDVIDGGERFLL